MSDGTHGPMDREDPMSNVYGFKWMPSTIFTRTLKGRYYYYFHFTYGKTEAWGSQVSCPKSHSWFQSQHPTPEREDYC